MNVGDGRVDDRGLGRTTDLREVGQELSEVQEATIERLSPLPLYGIVRCSPLCSVGSSRRLALHVGGVVSRCSGGSCGGGGIGGSGVVGGRLVFEGRSRFVLDVRVGVGACGIAGRRRRRR